MIEQQTIETDEISLKELIQKIKDWIGYLKTQWKIIFGVTTLGAIIGFTYASFQKPLYTANLTFALEEERTNSVSGAMGIASQLGVDLSNGGGGAFYGPNLIEFMKSRLIVEKVLLTPIEIDTKKTTLASLYLVSNNFKDSSVLNKINKFSSNKSNFRNFDFTIEENLILSKIYSDVISIKKLKIDKKEKDISITEVEVKNENELFAKLFCENLVYQTSQFYIETKSRKAKNNLEILKKQTDSIRGELNDAINDVALSTDNTFNLNPSLIIKKTQTSKKQIDVQANTVILTQLLTQLELAKVNLRKETPLFQVIDTPRYPLNQKKVSFIFAIVIFSFLFMFFTCISLIISKILIQKLK